jgi:hypothetical protein
MSVIRAWQSLSGPGAQPRPQRVGLKVCERGARAWPFFVGSGPPANWRVARIVPTGRSWAHLTSWLVGVHCFRLPCGGAAVPLNGRSSIRRRTPANTAPATPRPRFTANDVTPGARSRRRSSSTSYAALINGRWWLKPGVVKPPTVMAALRRKPASLRPAENKMHRNVIFITAAHRSNCLTSGSWLDGYRLRCGAFRDPAHVQDFERAADQARSSGLSRRRSVRVHRALCGHLRRPPREHLVRLAAGGPRLILNRQDRVSAGRR